MLVPGIFLSDTISTDQESDGLIRQDFMEEGI